MEFRTLGALEISCEDTPIRLSGSRRRALLALLLLHPGQIVSIDVIGEVLWPTDQPADPRAAVRFHVWAIRNALALDNVTADQSMVEHNGGGYKVTLAGNVFDTVEFFDRVSRAQLVVATSPTSALEHLVGALHLWRGTPFEELRYDDHARPVVRKLVELRLDAEMLRSEALLNLGRPREAIPVLESLVELHPLTEPLWRLLLTALTRCGRPAEALVEYRRMESTLATEVGVQPSRELRELKARISSDQAV